LLWFVVGANQLAFLVVFCTGYRLQLLPPYYYDREAYGLLVFVPRVAGTLAAVLALFCCRRFPEWRIVFGINLILFVLTTLGASEPYQSYWHSIESLFSSAPSISLSIVAAVLAAMTLFDLDCRKSTSRPLAHWAGIVVAILPLLWFVIGCQLQLAELRP